MTFNSNEGYSMSWSFGGSAQYSRNLKTLFALVALQTACAYLVPETIAKAPQPSEASSSNDAKVLPTDNFQCDQTCDPIRVESARRIIEQMKIFIGKADAQQKRIQEDFLLAEKLKG